MHDGVVEQIGAPLELYDRPANLFVAGFIGSPAMNILRGTRCGERGWRRETQRRRRPRCRRAAVKDGEARIRRTVCTRP